MRFVVILAALAAVVTARTSPHADLVQEYVRATVGTKFSTNILEDGLLDAPGLIKKYGYPLEVHQVQTDDGYILELHRIPHGRDRNNRPGRRTAVFLMHGLLSSSADFVITGPENAIAYQLAEEGYDVWMGNARGNYYSRRHRRLNPDSKINQKFWEFSWDEIGYYDLAASIDRVLQVTGESRIHYAGHSQGGTSFLILTSLRPEYNKKFISFQGLAPASFMAYNDYPPFKALAPHATAIEKAFFRLRIPELLGNREMFTLLGITVCPDQSFLQPLCTSLPYLGTELANINATMLPAHLGHAPAGASIRQLGHYAQCINSKQFRRYDYGALENLIKYSRFTPPKYPLDKITTPAYIHYSKADVFVHYKDVELLAGSLGNLVGLFEVSRPTFTHVDFIWAADCKDVFIGQLLDGLRSAERI